MFRKHYSLAHAEEVLKIVRRMMKGVKIDCTLDVWSNGREQGFHISRNDPQPGCEVVFAQQRTSDSVIVITGPSEEFDVTTNMPSKKLWGKDSKHLTVIYDDEKAARIIVDFLAFYPTRELVGQ